LLRSLSPSASNAVIVGRLARTAQPVTGALLGNGRIDLAGAAVDTSTVGVTPSGAPGGGGPIVSRYVTAASNLSNVTASAPTQVAGATETWTIGFKTSGGSGTAGALAAGGTITVTLASGFNTVASPTITLGVGF